MTLTKSDLNAIKSALQPEFVKTEERIRAALQPEFVKTEERIRAALQPEFKKLEKKIDRLRRDNRKDHNSIMKYLDQRDSRLEKKIVRLENHVGLPPIL